LYIYNLDCLIFTWARMWGSVVVCWSQKGSANQKVRETLVCGLCFSRRAL